jgi:hypothetical protein
VILGDGRQVKLAVNEVAMTTKRKQKSQGVTGRTGSEDGHVRIIRANRKLLLQLGRVREGKGPGTSWWASECLDYFKRPAKHEEILMHTCWACGCVNETHVLLCSYCHEQQPDGASRDLQMKWLRERQHCSDRVHEATGRLMANLATIFEGCSKDVVDGFNNWCLRSDCYGYSYRLAEQQTGSLVSQSCVTDELVIAAAKRWRDGTMAGEEIGRRHSDPVIRGLIEGLLDKRSQDQSPHAGE